MKKQNKTVEKNKNSKSKVLVTVAIASAAVVILALVIILPLIKINSDFDKIFEKMSAVNDPEIVITDMSAENVFGDTKGEVRVVSKDLVSQVCELAENFRYHGKDSDSMSAWDIRFRVKTEDGWVEIYLDEDNMYYVAGGNYYRFVPKNDETEKAYASFLDNVKKLLEK